MLFFFIFIVVKAPAHLASRVVDNFIPQLSIDQYTGTLWSGRASKVIAIVDGTAIYLGDLSWQVKPLSIFLLQPRVDIKSSAITHGFNAELSASPFGTVSVNNFFAYFPTAMLEPWLPLLVTGDVEVTVDTLSFSNESVSELAGHLTLDEAVWIAGDSDMLLGNYKANFSSGDDNKLIIKVFDINAALGIDAELSAELGEQSNGHYQFNARLKPGENLAIEITRTLQFFGKKNSRGEIIINQQGRW
jgi:hypothetical protein